MLNDFLIFMIMFITLDLNVIQNINLHDMMRYVTVFKFKEKLNYETNWKYESSVKWNYAQWFE